MMDVLKMIDNLRERLWKEYGDPMKAPYTQDEVHMTYYVGELLKRRGFDWFKAEDQEGACYTEKAVQKAFIAGLRLGERNAESMAKGIAQERMARAIDALKGHEDQL